MDERLHWLETYASHNGRHKPRTHDSVEALEMEPLPLFGLLSSWSEAFAMMLVLVGDFSTVRLFRSL